MSKSSHQIRIGQVGAGYAGAFHYDSLKTIDPCKIVAQADIDEKSHKLFIEQRPIPEYYKNCQEMLEVADIDAVTVSVPNCFHAEVAKAALMAGKHVFVEKPLALKLEDAEEIVHLSKIKGLLVGYGEELCYVPKYRRMKQIADSGALGKVYLIKQSERHGGPYSPWFYQKKMAGGGVLLDMGCHSIEFCRWIAGKQKVNWVSGYCGKFIHKHADVEDYVLATMEFEDGTLAQIEGSWCLQGGEDSIAEICGTQGVISGDLLKGMGIKAYTTNGYPGMPLNQANIDQSQSKGWSFPDYDWLWNNGYPQEMQDFISCIQKGGTLLESGEDGLAVLEIMLAIYQSAATGQRVNLPFQPKNVQYPIDLLSQKDRDYESRNIKSNEICQ